MIADKEYKVTLSGHVKGGATGTSTYDVVVNKPPANGKCSVSPEKGEPLNTPFTITCENFTDTKSDLPLTYTFFYNKTVGGPLSLLDQSLSPVLKDFRLSSGLKENNYIYNFVVKVMDKLGASVDHKIPETIRVGIVMSVRPFIFLHVTFVLVDRHLVLSLFLTGLGGFSQALGQLGLNKPEPYCQ